MLKVFSYGLLPPSQETKALIQEHLFLAHKYRNRLIEIERTRRLSLRQALSAYSDIQTLEASVEVTKKAFILASKAVKNARIETRDRKVPKDFQEALRAAKEALRTSRQTLRIRQSELRNDPVYLKEKERIEEASLAARKEARASSGVYWGTYQLIENAADTSFKRTAFDKDPPFLRFRGEGQLGVQIQKNPEDRSVPGLPSEALFRPNTIVWVDPVPEATTRSERRKLARTTLHFRLGSKDRKPIWIDIPLIMHRLIPSKTYIKRVTITKRNVGPFEEWTADFTVTDVQEVQVASKGIIGMDLGWRSFPDGSLRIAFWKSEDGESGDVRLSPELIRGLRIPDGLQRARDKIFEDIKARIAASRLEGFDNIKSQRRLAAFYLKWKDARIQGDEDIFEEVTSWYRRDRHLWQYETGQRSKAYRRRREFYRTTAAKLAETYRDLVLEDFDLRSVTEDRLEDEERNDRAQSNRQLAAVSEFRLILINAFLSRGGKVHKKPCQGTTITCSQCLSVEDFDKNELRHTCSNGHTWDQDENAAENLLRLWKEDPTDPPVIVRENRWAKIRRLRKELISGSDEA